MTQALEAGTKAPDFIIETTGGRKQLASYRGKYLILYFYPKDDTPGCTNEARDFSELSNQFELAGANILGVSRDSLAKHQKFIEKHDLKIELGSDEDGNVCDSYGTWVEKNMYGRSYMGIARSTFLIDPKGRICRIWPKVRVKGHAQAVLETLKV
ncbi:MAG: peroxiredoxin [Hyphomonas sp.]|tara:strand:+ start:919 stop:1383 length:465 start_codon:yes stop_codon:yes gene_type:complete